MCGPPRNRVHTDAAFLNEARVKIKGVWIALVSCDHLISNSQPWTSWIHKGVEDLPTPSRHCRPSEIPLWRRKKKLRNKNEKWWGPSKDLFVPIGPTAYKSLPTSRKVAWFDHGKISACGPLTVGHDASNPSQVSPIIQTIWGLRLPFQF